MELLVNDLSLHGQYRDLGIFRVAIGRVMLMRQVAHQFGGVLYCHHNLANAQVTPTLSMPQAVQGLSTNERRALLQWLTNVGPFWEDTRLHKESDYLECDGNIVTDTAVGEAAYCCFIGMHRDLVSFTPSSWQSSPLLVTWLSDDTHSRKVEVYNCWDIAGLEAVLSASPAPLTSWEQLGTTCRTRFPELKFADGSFGYLRGLPFAPSVARRVIELLDTLHQIVVSRDGQGKFSVAGQRLYQDHFVGDKAWFSDSSDSEKNDFKNELSFKHPDKHGEYLFCPWHGKVKTPQVRIHFSWPPRNEEPLYVVYVGPKITRH